MSRILKNKNRSLQEQEKIPNAGNKIFAKKKKREPIRHFADGNAKRSTMLEDVVQCGKEDETERQEVAAHKGSHSQASTNQMCSVKNHLGYFLNYNGSQPLHLKLRSSRHRMRHRVLYNEQALHSKQQKAKGKGF